MVSETINCMGRGWFDELEENSLWRLDWDVIGRKREGANQRGVYETPIINGPGKNVEDEEGIGCRM